ncbi:porin family protein [Phenylobacterium sp.]|uniref:outer membrane protein n=1 Tax=Phenylobacterium sp. TaxID=1871053 RepID=UPI00289E828B|nr:porin family protein [Phenylobacterium sp.]
MKFWISPLAAALALGATAASAEPFQGFHAGVGVGGSKLQSQDNIPGFTRKADDDAKGFTYRGFVGYDIKLSERVVLGVEAGVSNGDKKIESRVDTARVKVDPGVGYDVTGRLGLVATDNLMVYGRAGWAREKFEREIRFSNNSAVLHNDKDANGALFGVGAEYALSDNVAVRAEYDRTNFKDDRKRDRLMVSAAYRF